MARYYSSTPAFDTNLHLLFSFLPQVYLGSEPGGIVKVIDAFDPYKSGGPAGPVRRKFEDIPTRGGLTIALRPLKQNPQIAGIVINGYSYANTFLEDLPTVPAAPGESEDFTPLNNIGPRLPADPSLIYDPSLNPKFLPKHGAPAGPVTKSAIPPSGSSHVPGRYNMGGSNSGSNIPGASAKQGMQGNANSLLKTPPSPGSGGLGLGVAPSTTQNQYGALIGGAMPGHGLPLNPVSRTALPATPANQRPAVAQQIYRRRLASISDGQTNSVEDITARVDSLTSQLANGQGYQPAAGIQTLYAPISQQDGKPYSLDAISGPGSVGISNNYNVDSSSTRTGSSPSSVGRGDIPEVGSPNGQDSLGGIQETGAHENMRQAQDGIQGPQQGPGLLSNGVTTALQGNGVSTPFGAAPDHQAINSDSTQIASHLEEDRNQNQQYDTSRTAPKGVGESTDDSHSSQNSGIGGAMNLGSTVPEVGAAETGTTNGKQDQIPLQGAQNLGEPKRSGDGISRMAASAEPQANYPGTVLGGASSFGGLQQGRMERPGLGHQAVAALGTGLGQRNSQAVVGSPSRQQETSISGLSALGDIPGLADGMGENSSTDEGGRRMHSAGVYGGNSALDGICLDNSTHCSCGMADTLDRAPEECLYVVSERSDPMICERRPCSGKLVCACAPGANSLCQRSLVRSILVPASVHRHGVTADPNVVLCRRETLEHGVGVLTPVL